MTPIFKKDELPWAELQQLGLASGDKLLLDKDRQDSLLAGLRTDFVRLQNLRSDGIDFPQWDVRLSIRRSPEGMLSLRLHPIYKSHVNHPMLSEMEQFSLAFGKTENISKYRLSEEGKRVQTIIEYDPSTREFVSYDPHQVIAPDKVNGIPLSELQKEGFREGRVIELSDKTKVQFRAAEPQGITANRSALILSFDTAGGPDILHLHEVQNLFSNQHRQLSPHSKAFDQAARELFREQQAEKSQPLLSVNPIQSGEPDNRQIGR